MFGRSFSELRTGRDLNGQVWRTGGPSGSPRGVLPVDGRVTPLVERSNGGRCLAVGLWMGAKAMGFGRG